MSSYERAVAVVGVGAVLPDALDAPTFWQNILDKKYSIREVPAGRWDPADYYDPDPKAPDKTYSKIGGWVTGFEFDWRRFRMPPKVAAAMDPGQQWAVTIAAEALADYGYPERPLNTENTAVILGTAMGGDSSYVTHLRVAFPEYANALNEVSEFTDLPAGVRDAIVTQWQARIGDRIPPITEDTMPGELPNIVSGRVANMLNLRGPNFITDAACASSFAAIKAAMELLVEHEADAVLAGGVDHNMGISPFVKFCKIGALSATGSRPFGEGADGFVMGEGAAAFLLKRLEDAERQGDKIYAVIRGVGGSSDGKGKGITAPNPIGQQLAIQRAWENAALDPTTATMVEAHGTSTRVGDVVEVESLNKIFGTAGKNTIGLGSAKSNIGHLKAGAGAAGLLKAIYALHHKVLPPTLHAETPNPNVDLEQSPFYLLHEAQAWRKANGTPRRCGVSAYGFGGTNFHVVMEEYVPGLLAQERRERAAAVQPVPAATAEPRPFRGILALGAVSPQELAEKLDTALNRVKNGWTPDLDRLPPAVDILAEERLVVDFGSHEELLDRLEKARKVMSFDTAQAWQAMEAQGIFRGSGAPQGKIAFLFPGQGSQYVNMGREFLDLSPVVAEMFREADEVMTPILGRPLSDYIFVDTDDSAAMMQANMDLLQTEITQPAMLALDIAMLKLLAEYGFAPDMVMGHSLGEYAALIAAGALPFADALEAVAARGSEMKKVSWDDNGRMAAVLAPYEAVVETLAQVDGYVVPANINSASQSVIGGASAAVEEASTRFEEQGYRVIQIPVSHAFHTKIVAPASEPLREVLDRLRFREAQLPIVANVTGERYPQTVDAIKDMLQVQVASPVQWVKGLETLYEEGVRTFVEVGPKRALRGFVRDVFREKEDVQALMTNHPKTGALPAFNQALCGLYAAGYTGNLPLPAEKARTPAAAATNREPEPTAAAIPVDAAALENLVMKAVQKALGTAAQPNGRPDGPYDRNEVPLGSVVISGTGLGLPGAEKAVMDPENALRILQGEQFVDLIPERFRQRMVDKRITRLMKGADGAGSFYTITDPDEVIKLAGRPGTFDLEAEYGVPASLIEALDITSELAIAAGLDALREAGIPLVQTYRRTTTGKYLPDRWVLPEALRDETGVIFASAFPGGDQFAREFERYYEWHNMVTQMEMLEDLRRYTEDKKTAAELDRRLGILRERLEADPYTFDRRFIFRILSMGHSQFAQFIGARGPNTHVNAACASTAQGVALAEDWIRSGRCRRVIVIGADAVTSDSLMEWVGSGFLAVGAVTTKDRVAEAALPFDKRRHGTILGMGACALVVESEDTVRERGMRGIVELLSSETSNSAFHGTRLDVNHIAQVMGRLVGAAEQRFGLVRQAMAPQTVFMSHETFTPARGGSAAAEIVALRETFGAGASDIIIANTKGFTGHPMGVGVEDVIAVKILEHGIVPPVPNFKEVDPDLGPLNLSRGGRYPVQYAIHLAAGFGSQIAMTLTRRIPGDLDRIDDRGQYGRWLAALSGYATAETEVEKRVLRIAAQGAPLNPPAQSTWVYGTGPVQRAVEPAANGEVAYPAHMAAAPLPPPPAAAPPVPQSTPPPVPQPIAPPPVAPPPPAAVPPPAPEVDIVQQEIIALVAAQTGYPADMLDLDLDLEADLGIDTVKQAETFLAVREAFDIPQQDNVSLRDYNTLEKVIQFVKEMRPDLVQEAAAAPPVPEPQPAAAPEDAAQPAEDTITAQVLALVSGQTGYPPEMLDLDLDLEADLGIDTVKQAETFLAIREAFDIPQQDNVSLRDYNTLEKVIGFVREMRPDLASAVDAVPPVVAAAPAAAAAPPGEITQPGAGDMVTERILALVAEQTGYPPEMLELDLDLEADLGVDTVKQAETFLAIREAFEIPQQENLSLRDYNTLEKVIGFVYEMRPDLIQTAAAPMVPGPDAESAAAQAVAPDTAVAGDPVASQVLALVAAQTGYPEEMLELDLDLEADLGVDTVKQAETFLAIRETFDIPQQENLSLRDYNTLEKVIAFVHAMRPDLASAAAPTAPAAAPDTAVAGDPVASQVLALVAAQTGYPEEMLELDLDLEADLGVDTVKQAETFLAIRETFDIPQQDNLSLRDYNTLEKVIAFVYEMRPDLVQPAGATVPPEQQVPTSTAEAVPAPADSIVAQVLALVAAQTGYPEEMLELDLDLEADLGIDTVKQAETFLAIRETFDIPQQENVSLRDYNTLEKVIGFVREMRPDLGQAVPTATVVSVEAADQEPQQDGRAAAAAQYTLADADTMPRRVPVPALRPDLTLCLPTGVTLDANSRVVLMPDQGGVAKALVSRLEKLGVSVLQLDPGDDQDALAAQLGAWLKEGAIQGVYWLPALDVEPALETLDLAAWRGHNRLRVKGLYTTMRLLYDQVAAPGSFLLAATRLGGWHGYGRDGATAPLGGAVTGFTKAYAVEQRLRAESAGPLVKAVDFAPSRKTAALADHLIAETLADPGVVEVGIRDGQRYTVTLLDEPAANGQPGLALDEETVFLVTGAAGGITSEIVSDLAGASHGVFYLLDLVPEPARDDAQIALFRQDRDALKKQLIEAARAAGDRPTPVQIEQQIAHVERNEAALRAVEAVEAAGGTAIYRAVDLLDGDAVTAVIDEIREAYGRIDVLIHAAGLLIDRTLPNKEPQQFDLVFDVKADGFFNLLRASAGLPIAATVAFSSVAGRFGNNGQTDYSAANDLLCKLSTNMSLWRPETRAIAIDWTAWGEIGMAARGSVPTIMKALGIDMLPPEAGVPTVRRELVAGGFSGEVLVAGALGIMAAELDETGGLDVDKARLALGDRAADLIMIGEVKAALLYGGLQIETVLDPQEQPFLYDHAPDPDTPWLPGVMAIEGMAEAAALAAPGYHVAAVEDVEMLGAFKFFRNEPRPLTLSVVLMPGAAADELFAVVTLRSITPPAREGLPTREQTHFRSRVVLKPTPPSSETIDFTAPAVETMPVTAETLYEQFFHGLAYQVLARVGVDGSRTTGLFAADLPPNTSPAGLPVLMAPRLVELCFQAAAQWHVETSQAMAFPLGLQALTVIRQEEAAASQELYGLLVTDDEGATFEARVVDSSGAVYVVLHGYRTVSRPQTE